MAGGPPAAAGSALRAAADGDLGTVYRAARAPEAGEALELGLGSARSVGSVTVLQSAGSEALADIQPPGHRRDLEDRRCARRPLHQGECDRPDGRCGTSRLACRVRCTADRRAGGRLNA
ncbi:hypothetical protein GCM10018966_097200 [Streptomyces yanii]